MATSQKQEPSSAASGNGGNGSEAAQHLGRVIDDSLFAMHFQPIVDLRTQSIFGHEALCRPQDSYFESPTQLISAAVESESIGELGRMLRAAALEGSADSTLFLNLEPHEFNEPWLVRPDDPIFKHRHPVYLEITENVPLKYFDQCHSVLAELRRKGTLLAIDDFGAGFSNLKYIAELEPDIVKLDRELIRECRVDTSGFRLIRSITELCHQMNAKVVAEGIETVDELEAVLAGGVDYGQGYLLARPAAQPPQIEWPSGLVRTDEAAPVDQQHEAENPSRETDLSSPSSRELALHAEIKELNDLLVQSEVGRLDLVKRLKEQSGPAVDPLPDDEAQAEAESPASAATSSENSVERHPLFPRLFFVVALLLALLVAASVFWPSSPEDSESDASAETKTPDEDLAGSAVPALQTADRSLSPKQSLSSSAAPTADPEPAPAVIAAEIANRIDAWAKAWSQQRAEDYLSFYSVQFQSASGAGYQNWSRGKRQRIQQPAWINVNVSHLDFTFPQPGRARARFHQAYSSPEYSDEVKKTLVWALEGGQWRILSESSEPLP